MDTGRKSIGDTDYRSHLWRKIPILLAVLSLSALLLGTWLTAFAAPGDDSNVRSPRQPAAPTDLDFSIVKSDQEPFIVGSGNRYTIRVASTGTLSGAVQVAVEDILPSFITVADPATDIVAEDWDCTSSTTTRVYCIYTGSLSDGSVQFRPIILYATVAPDVQPIVTNTARLIIDGNNTDPTPGNNQSTITTTIDSVDLSIVKDLDPQYADVGVPVNYILAITNDGPSEATNVEVVDSLPTGVTFDCANSSSTTTPNIQCNLITGTDNFTATWQLGNMVKGETITLTLPAVPDADAAGEDLINTAIVTSTNTSDWDTDNNEDSARLFVSGLDIEKLVSDEHVSVGDHFLYTINVVNNGTQPANSVRVRDTFTSTLDVVSAAYRINGGVWVPFTTGNSMNRLIGTLNTGHTATVSVTVRGNDTIVISSTVTNTARVTASPSVERYSDVVTTTIDSAADLEVTKTVYDPNNRNLDEEVTPGLTFSYTVNIENIGNITATGIVVTDTLIGPLSYRSLFTNGLTMTLTNTVGSTIRAWDLEDLVLEPNEEVWFRVGVRVSDNENNIGEFVSNQAYASTTSTETWTLNNLGIADPSEIIAPPENLKIKLSRRPSQAGVGESFFFTIVVENDSNREATDVEVFDKFPSVLDITGVSTNQGTASTNATAREVTVNIGDLDDGDVVTITISTRVNSTAVASARYSHSSLLSWDPNNERRSNTVEFRIVTSTLPGTGGMAAAGSNPLFLLGILSGLLLSGLGLAALLYSLWSRTRRPLWTAWFGRAGVILLAAGLAIILLGFTLRSDDQPLPQLARIDSNKASVPTLPPTSPGPKDRSSNTNDNQEWEPTPTPSSLPDYPIPTPPANSSSGADSDSTSIQRIMIPRLGVDAVVKYVPYNGQTWLIGGLKQEVAWMGDTSWPGLGGNTALAGHVDLYDGSDGPFRYLYEVEPGDEVILYTEENIYSYKVREQIVVPDDDLTVIEPSANPQLTLITCTGWDDELRLYIQRLVVHADLVEVKPIRSPQATLPLENFGGAANLPKVDEAAAPTAKVEPTAQPQIDYNRLAEQLTAAEINPYIPGRKAIYVDQEQQTMYVFKDGKQVRALPISSGKAEYFTPAYTGYVKYYVDTIESDEGLLADDAWYLFTNTGRIYIHGAPYDTKSDGTKEYVELDLIGNTPASHGCIRLYPEDAQWLTDWNPEGAAIVITPSVQ